MSTLTPVRRRTVAPAPLGRKTCWAVALLMPVGPAAIGLLRYVLPYFSETTAAGTVAAVEAHPTAQSLVLWLGYLGLLTLVPGVLAAAQLTRSGAPRLTGVAVALLVPAYLSLSGLLVTDNVLWSGQRADIDAPAVTALLDAAHPTVVISLVVFVVGHVLGTVLLGIAFLRTSRIPVWAAVTLTVSQPVHFLAAVVLINPTLDLIGWSATAVGMAMAARAVVRAAPSPAQPPV